jgi:hypothetical protein
LNKRTEIFLIGFFLLWVGVAAYLFAQEGSEGGAPCVLSGNVNYKDVKDSDGLKVEAIIDDKTFAQTITQNGQYNLSIPPDSISTPTKEGWSAGQIIYFKINGFPALQTFVAKAGSYKLDLSVASSDVKLTTWGKIKALFK